MERRDLARQRAFLLQARARFERTLSFDPENVAAHYNLALIHAQLDAAAKAAEHRRLHERYRPNDNARDLAVAAARRRDPAANHAAQATVIYDLQRPGAFGLDPAARSGALAGLPGP
jgi:hypothetical protein